MAYTNPSYTPLFPQRFRRPTAAFVEHFPRIRFTYGITALNILLHGPFFTVPDSQRTAK
jgi:hypothetical protein